MPTDDEGVIRLHNKVVELHGCYVRRMANCIVRLDGTQNRIGYETEDQLVLSKVLSVDESMLVDLPEDDDAD